jgi:hypothetical protein
MIPLERGSASPFYFDGFIGTGNDTVTISGIFIQAINPLAAAGTYAKVDIDNYWTLNRFNKEPNKPDPDLPAVNIPALINSQAPLIFIITDSFWVFQVGKQPKYYMDYSKQWMDILQKDYPAKFNQLAGIVNDILRSQ